MHLTFFLSTRIMMTKKSGRPLTFVAFYTTFVCILFGTPSLLYFCNFLYKFMLVSVPFYLYTLLYHDVYSGSYVYIKCF